MEAANRGSVKAFNHILDLAYGRKGKLKWEIMKVRHYPRCFPKFCTAQHSKSLFYLTLMRQFLPESFWPNPNHNRLSILRN